MQPTLPSHEIIAKELGIERLPSADQDEILALLGQNIFEAVTVAALLRLPQEAQGEFRRQVDARNSDAAAKILSPYVGDVEAFVAAETKKEVDAFKQKFADLSKE